MRMFSQLQFRAHNKHKEPKASKKSLSLFLGLLTPTTQHRIPEFSPSAQSFLSSSSVSLSLSEELSSFAFGYIKKTSSLARFYILPLSLLRKKGEKVALR